MYEWIISFFFFKQKTAYEMRISDWSSDVCTSDLPQSVGAFVVQSFIPRQRKVRILATLGPASANPAMIAELHRAAAGAFRVNMSHGDHQGHAKRPEDRRVGKEALSTWRFRWSPYH